MIHSNTMKVLALLKQRYTTNRDILMKVGTTEGRKEISRIRKLDGWEIKSRWVSQNGKRFKEYKAVKV